MRAALGVILALLLVPSISNAKPKPQVIPPMPAGFDDAGPPPSDVPLKIVARLRTYLRDPYSIRDLAVCDPARIEVRYLAEWLPAKWTVLLTLNSKNGYGAYAGITPFHASFKNGEVSDFYEVPTGDMDAESKARMDTRLATCRPISDAETQRLLSHSR